MSFHDRLGVTPMVSTDEFTDYGLAMLNALNLELWVGLEADEAEFPE